MLPLGLVAFGRRMFWHAFCVFSMLAASCSLEPTALSAQGPADVEESKIKSFLSQSTWARQPGSNRYCPALLDDLAAGSPRVRFIEPTVAVPEYDAASFSSYQSRCPDMPLNQFAEGDFDMTWIGSRNAKMFELEQPSGETWFVFYAEAFFNELIANRVPMGGYAFGPGNSAYYIVYDLENCKPMDLAPVHEPVFHLTGEELPNVNALAEYEGDFFLIDLFAEFNARDTRYAQAMLLNDSTPTMINRVCSFRNNQ